MEPVQHAESSQATLDEILETEGSLYSRQYTLGFRSLRFIPALEAEYREYALLHSPEPLRALLPLSLLLTLLFWGQEYLRFPPEVFRELAVPRGIQVMALLVLAIPVYLRQYRIAQLCIILTVLTYGVTTAQTNGITNREAMYSPAMSMLIILTANYFLTGLRFYQAALTGVMVSLTYPLSQLFFSFPLPNMAVNCFNIALFNVMGIAGAYAREYTHRENYLGRQLLNELAMFDGLTGLLNRRAFALDLDKICAQAKRDKVDIAVAMADVDFFKDYNDHYGHVKGDQCLRSLAGALRTTLKRPLDKAGRYGGEEFILVWYDCSAADARRLGEEARTAVEALRLRHGDDARQRWVTISVGIASSAAFEDYDSGRLIRAADRALYHAKAQGRNRVTLDAEPIGTSHV
jgi:diguanylate cyclase (GGDEF)-like protein